MKTKLSHAGCFFSLSAALVPAIVLALAVLMYTQSCLHLRWFRLKLCCHVCLPACLPAGNACLNANEFTAGFAEEALTALEAQSQENSRLRQRIAAGSSQGSGQ